MSDYFIKVGSGDPVKLDLAKVSKLTRTQASLASSWLGISTTENFADTLQWATEQVCDLFLGTTRIFRGTIIEPTKQASPQVQGAQYLVECPWRQFRRTPYLQQFALLAGVFDIPWFQVWGDGSAANTIQAVCDSLIADQAAWPAQLPVVWTKGIIDADIPMRPSKADTAMCSEVVLRSAQFQADCGQWWDWSAPVPTFNVRRWTNMDVVELPLGGDGTGMVRWQVQQSQERRLRYVRIVMVDQETLAGVNYKFAVEATAPLGYAGPLEGGVAAQLDFNSLFALEAASGFAQTMWESTQNVDWLGSVTVQGVDIATRLRPGVVVNQIGGAPEMANMRALVQQTTDDLLTGTTTATFGPHLTISVQNVQSMLRSIWPAVSQAEQTEQQTGNNPESSAGRSDKNKNKSAVGAKITTFETMKVVGSSAVPTLVKVPSSDA